MKICYFGMYAPNYSRNHILIKGFKENGVEIVECNVRSHLVWGFRHLKLVKKFIGIKGWNCDLIFVGFPGQTDVPLAWVLGKIFHKKVVFDAFYSLYCSYVYDRKYFSKNSWKAKLWWFIDWISCVLADKVILDTNEHIKYFVKTFGIKKEKFSRVFVGTDTDIFFPRKTQSRQGFSVGFHGSYLPLQGVDIIIETAKLLPEVIFRLLGNGLERKNIEILVHKHQLKNVQFLEQIPYGELAHFISSSDIYLGGPFGGNIKSRLVIPNKVYEAMACKKPVIIGESAATQELFKDKIHCLFITQNNPIDLARGILELKNNNLLREKIAAEGYNLVINNFNPKRIVDNLIHELNI